MTVTGTLVNLYHICHRELWLHARGVRMEHTSDVVFEGKLIGELSYPQRAARYTEVEIGGSKIDYYDPQARVVHEVKKSDKAQAAHVAQVKFYLWLLEQHGVGEATGRLEYPKQRKNETVELLDADRAAIPSWIENITRIVTSDVCPPLLGKPICRRCSYHDFCYATEETP